MHDGREVAWGSLLGLLGLCGDGRCQRFPQRVARRGEFGREQVAGCALEPAVDDLAQPAAAQCALDGRVVLGGPHSFSSRRIPSSTCCCAYANPSDRPLFAAASGSVLSSFLARARMVFSSTACFRFVAFQFIFICGENPFVTISVREEDRARRDKGLSAAPGHVAQRSPKTISTHVSGFITLGVVLCRR